MTALANDEESWDSFEVHLQQEGPGNLKMMHRAVCVYDSSWSREISRKDQKGINHTWWYLLVMAADAFELFVEFYVPFFTPILRNFCGAEAA